MGLFEFSMTDVVMWAAAVAVTITLLSGIMVRRRTLYNETLQGYVKRCQSDEPEMPGDQPTES